MSYELKSARYLAREVILRTVQPGDAVVDATMGNGHDTLMLCEAAGPSGRVYAFDVQAQAVAETEKRLREQGMSGRAVLIHAGHEHMAEYVQEPVRAVMFNLGWLPGAPHGVTTRVETTLLAVDAALSILKPDGIMTVCVYPGHGEGARELEALNAWAAALDPRRYDAMLRRYVNQPNDPPQLIAVRRVRR